MIRIRPKGADGRAGDHVKSCEEWLRLFEEATRSLQAREQSIALDFSGESPDREWTGEALHDRVCTD